MESKGEVNVSHYYFLSQSIPPLQAYLWHNNEAVVEWLEQQLLGGEQSVLKQNTDCIKRERIARDVAK